MTPDRRSLLRQVSSLLVRALLARIDAEWRAERAIGLATDLGYDDCPVCLAARR